VDVCKIAPGRYHFETLFSMDGDHAPIGEIMTLAADYECTVICDDAHATGVLGEKGCGLAGDADIIMGTFSKALGGFGAYVACSNAVRDFLVNRCGGLIYSTALSLSVLGAIDAALDLVPGLDGERALVARHAETFRTQIRFFGLDVGNSTTQIVPVILGPADSAVALSAHLREAGFWSTPIRPPTVPRDTARLRITFTAAHTDDNLRNLIAVFRDWRQSSSGYSQLADLSASSP